MNVSLKDLRSAARTQAERAGLQEAFEALRHVNRVEIINSCINYRDSCTNSRAEIPPLALHPATTPRRPRNIFPCTQIHQTNFSSRVLPLLLRVAKEEKSSKESDRASERNMKRGFGGKDKYTNSISPLRSEHF